MSTNEIIKNCKKATLGAGVGTIDSFDDGTAVSDFCKEWYELIVEAELSLYKWRFATKTFDLGNSLIAGIPDSRYNNAWQLPNDVLSIDTVLVNDRPVEYDQIGDQIHTNDLSNDNPILQYRFRADESKWKPYFKLLVIYRLATMLSFSIARKTDIAKEMKGLADYHWRLSKTEDAQSKTQRGVNVSKIRLARGGRLSKFWRDR